MFKWFKKKDKKNEEIVEREEVVEEVDEIENLEEVEEEVEEKIDESIGIESEVEEEKEEVTEEKAPKELSLFEKLMGGLTKTRNDISNKIDGILKSYKKIDEDLFDDLE